MNKDQLSAEWIKKNGNKIKEVYDICMKHHYNFRSGDKLLEILKVIDPENANKEYAENLSKVLQLFDSQVTQTLIPKKGGRK